MAKTTNPYKAFMPFRFEAPTGLIVETFPMSTDPSGGAWRSIGFIDCPFEGDSLAHDLDGAGTLFHIQFNERILPGKVRDEVLAKRVADIEQLDGRKINKKDYAQLREQVEFDLLPRAFIRRTVVPVMFVKATRQVLIFTSSAKRCDDVIGLLCGAIEGLKIISIDATPARLLDNLCLGNECYTDDQDKIEATDSGVFKGENKRTVRVKGREIDSPEVGEIIAAGYKASELGIAFTEHASTEPQSVATLNDQLVFKRVEHAGIAQAKGSELDEHAFAWMTLKAHSRLLGVVLELCANATEAGPDDDEL